MKQDERRLAERHSPPKPVPATFGGFEVKIIDIGLVGCGIEHTDRLPPKAHLGLKFTWRGAQVRVDATVIRSELTFRNGKPLYVSGLQLAESAEKSPPVIRDIVSWLVAAAKKNEPPAPAPVPSEPLPVADEVEEVEEIESLSANYLRCTFTGGQWLNVFVDDPSQPAEGFTIPAPTDDKEADVLRRAYAKGNAETRRLMRASFEKDLARR